MQTYYYPASGALKAERGLSLALGFFDGVHLGHRKIIEESVKEGKKNGLIPAVFTFPSESEKIKSGAGRLYSTADKLSLFESLGVEITVVCDFSAVSSLSPKEFVEDVLLGGLNARAVFCGYNYRFGKSAAGNADTLCTLLGDRATLTVFEEMRFGDEELSTTKIKEALAAGNTELAAEMLGEEYFVTSTVERGLGIGKKSGFPTINCALPEGCPLPYGVYKTRVRIDNESFIGLTNVGECPTFGKRAPHIETKLLGVDRDLYGKMTKTSFVRYLRPEMTFSGAEELRKQIEKDERDALADEFAGEFAGK